MSWWNCNENCHILLFCVHLCTFPQQFHGKYINNTTVVLSKFRTFIEGEEFVYRVVNGRPGKLGEVPYQISIMKKVDEDKYVSFCGGSIIQPKKVLTAAHCITPDYIQNVKGKRKKKKGDIKDLAVAAGQLWTTTKFDYQGQWRKLSTGKYLPSYKFPKDDIALLFLQKKFDYNLGVQPIPYATKYADLKRNCKASGYGFVNNEKQSQVLLVAFIETMHRRKCDRIHRRNTYKLVCTTDSIANIHSGDSGGPLVCKDTGDPAENKHGVQIGVVCAGHDHVKEMTIFTRVSEYNDFINSTTSKSNITLSSVFTLTISTVFCCYINLS